MVTTRVSTFQLHQSLTQDYQLVQTRLADSQRQISSGKKADVFFDLNGSVERLKVFENKLDATEQYVETNTQVIARLQAMVSSTTDVLNSLDDIKDIVVLARGATEAQYPIFAQEVEAKIARVAANLNVSIGGRYLFAGGKTNIRPVAEPPGAPPTPGVPSNHYYRGDQTTLQARATENLLIDYGVTAEDPAFQQAIMALYSAFDAMNGGKNGSLVEGALDDLNVAIEEINALRSKMEGNRVTLEETNGIHDATITYLKTNIGLVADADIVELSTLIAQDQGVLQGAFQAFATISSLRLTDFLR